MEKYMEEKKQYYMNIMNAISEHKDFGKRNPVDIGIDCGYTEEDVLGMIEMLRKMQDEEDGKKVLGKENGEKGIYYFFIRKKEGAFIVQVNRNTWKVEIVEKIVDYEDDYNRYDIRGNIFVRTYGNGERGQKTLLWENIETKETKKLLTDKSIEDLMILETGVLIVMEHELQIWNGEDILARKKHEKYFSRYSSSLIEAKNDIYISDGRDLYSIDKELKNEFKEHCVIEPPTAGLVSQSYSIQELGVDEGKIFGYGSYERYGSGFLNTTKYYVDSPLKLNTGVEKQFPFSREIKNHNRFLSKAFRDFTTKNYGLLGTEIYSREQMESEPKSKFVIFDSEPVCIFRRCIQRKQVIAEYDKDTFIALSENDDIIKIDLKNEREATVIPVIVSDN